MRLHKALFAVIDEPDHAFVLDRGQEQRIRLNIHNYFALQQLRPSDAFQRAGAN